MTMNFSTTDYDAALATWLEGCKAIHAKHIRELAPKIADMEIAKPWRIDRGKRYDKIVHADSAFAFIDKNTGDVLKPDGWKAPAKHARGNIYDEHNGLKYMGPYGPASLR